MTPPGCLAEPASGRGPGVLVLHAWWGLNDTIREVCTRLADAGFVAFAPDLYRGAIASTIAEAEALGKALDARFHEARADVARAAQCLAARADGAPSGLAVVGFSMGAYYALDLAATSAEDIRSVVVFYGTGVDDHGVSKAAYLGHFAQDDPYEPAASIDHLQGSLQRAGRPVTIHRYPGTGHWFFERDRPQAYDAAAAALAWERTLAFLRRGHG